MCYCENIKVGSYDNQTEVSTPIHFNSTRDVKTICIDTCLLEEIKWLWTQGIITTGCCCGHNKILPYIGVIDDHIDKMIDLGYTVQRNTCEYMSLRRDSFYPKSVNITPKMVEHSLRHYGNISWKDCSESNTINKLMDDYYRTLMDEQ